MTNWICCLVLNPKNIVGTIRNFVSIGGFGMVESLMDRVDYAADGG